MAKLGGDVTDEYHNEKNESYNQGRLLSPEKDGSGLPKKTVRVKVNFLQIPGFRDLPSLVHIDVSDHILDEIDK